MSSELEPQTVDAPTPVKLVSLLALLVGIFSILGGILLITAAIGNVAGAGLSHLALILYGIFYLIIGFIALAVYKGLKRGEPWARILFTIVLVIAIIGDIGQIIAGGSVSSAISRSATTGFLSLSRGTVRSTSPRRTCRNRFEPIASW